MRALALLTMVAMAGCATPATRAPSLAPRAAEAIDPRVPVPDGPVSTAVDPALAARLAALVAQAEAGHAQFRAAAGPAQQAAAAAGGPQSESWIAAQQALSALIAARAPVTGALGDLDGLAAERIQKLGGIAAGDLRALEAATARVGEIDRGESALIDQLQARLR